MTASPQAVNLVPGVIDVLWTEDNQRKITRGEKTLADPRLLLISESDRVDYVERVIADGIDTSDAIWLGPAISTEVRA